MASARLSGGIKTASSLFQPPPPPLAGGGGGVPAWGVQPPRLKARIFLFTIWPFWDPFFGVFFQPSPASPRVLKQRTDLSVDFEFQSQLFFLNPPKYNAPPGCYI